MFPHSNRCVKETGKLHCLASPPTVVSPPQHSLTYHTPTMNNDKLPPDDWVHPVIVPKDPQSQSANGWHISQQQHIDDTAFAGSNSFAALQVCFMTLLGLKYNTYSFYRAIAIRQMVRHPQCSKICSNTATVTAIFEFQTMATLHTVPLPQPPLSQVIPIQPLIIPVLLALPSTQVRRVAHPPHRCSQIIPNKTLTPLAHLCLRTMLVCRTMRRAHPALAILQILKHCLLIAMLLLHLATTWGWCPRVFMRQQCCLVRKITSFQN